MSKIEVGDTFRDNNLFAHFVCTGTDGNLIYSKFDKLHKKADCTLVVKKSGGILSKKELNKMVESLFSDDAVIREGDSFIDSDYPGCVFSCEEYCAFNNGSDEDLICSSILDNHMVKNCTKVTDLSYKEVKPKVIRKIKREALEEWAFKQCGFYIKKSAGNEKNKGKGNIFCFIDSCNRGFGDTIGEAIIDLRKNMRKNGLKVERL